MGHTSSRFADDALLEGDGNLLRLLPLLAPPSPARIPFGLKPLPDLPRTTCENITLGNQPPPARALNDKLLLRVRNKLAPLVSL